MVGCKPCRFLHQYKDHAWVAKGGSLSSPRDEAFRGVQFHTNKTCTHAPFWKEKCNGTKKFLWWELKPYTKHGCRIISPQSLSLRPHTIPRRPNKCTWAPNRFLLIIIFEAPTILWCSHKCISGKWRDFKTLTLTCTVHMCLTHCSLAVTDDVTCQRDV